MERKYARAVSEVAKLQDKLKSGIASATDKDTKELQEKLAAQQAEMSRLQEDLQTLSQLAGENQGSLSGAQDEIIRVSEALAQLYHHVCMAQGKTPDRVMLDHMKAMRLRQGDVELPVSESGDVSGAESGTDSAAQQMIIIRAAKPVISEKFIESLKERLKSEFRTKLIEEQRKHLNSKSGHKEGTVFQVLETVNDQVKYLRRAVESALEMANRSAGESNATPDFEELQEQNIKLRALLSTKREQIATLRTVLKSNKLTAEAALGNLKQKYEKEKILVSDTMSKLRQELKGLKEDAATFASLRAMFAARCEENQAQVRS